MRRLTPVALLLVLAACADHRRLSRRRARHRRPQGWCATVREVDERFGPADNSDGSFEGASGQVAERIGRNSSASSTMASLSSTPPIATPSQQSGIRPCVSHRALVAADDGRDARTTRRAPLRTRQADPERRRPLDPEELRVDSRARGRQLADIRAHPNRKQPRPARSHPAGTEPGPERTVTVSGANPVGPDRCSGSAELSGKGSLRHTRTRSPRARVTRLARTVVRESHRLVGHLATTRRP